MTRTTTCRRMCALTAGVALAAAGCFGPLVRTSNIIERLRPTTTASRSEIVLLDVAVIEVPVTDRKSLAAVWSAADEQVIQPEFKARLEDNGLRVGVIGGIPPSALLELLTSPRTNADPHQWRKKSGEGRLLTFGGVQPECRLQLVQDGVATSPTFSDAQCGMFVTPTTAGDEIKLQIVPQIQHGSKNPWPAPDGAGGLTMHGQRPTERFTAISFEVRLGGADYLLLGASEKPQSFGRASFLATGDRPVLRLVVIRTSRPAEGAVWPTPSDRGTMPPLAVQASKSH